MSIVAERHLDLVTKEVEAYEAKHQTLPEASPTEVLAILNGKRKLNTRQVKALAARFNVSPAVFL